MVQLIGPHSRVWKVQAVLMTLLELDSPLPRCRIGESRMQEVIAGSVRDCTAASVRGPGRTQMSLPLKVYDWDAHFRPANCTYGRWACTHQYADDGMRSPTRNVPIARSTLSTHVLPACVANDAEGTRNCPHTQYCMCMTLEAWLAAQSRPSSTGGA